MSCRRCGSKTSSSSSSCKKCQSSSSSSSSSDECSSSSSSSSSCRPCKKERRSPRRRTLPSAWEPGVAGYYDDNFYDSPKGGIQACHNAGCQKVTKYRIDGKKGRHCFPGVSTTTVEACTVKTCLMAAQCVKAVGAELGDLDVRGRITVNGKDISSPDESVVLSNNAGQIDVIPERDQRALILEGLIPIPQGIYRPLPALDLPHYVSLYQINDRQSIRNLSELKQLYSKIVITNVGEVFRRVSFVLSVFSLNPRGQYVLQTLDLAIETMAPEAIHTFEVNWHSWRSCLNIIPEAVEIGIFTSVMIVGQPSDLAFLRTFSFITESLSTTIYAIYSGFCREDSCRERDCGPDIGRERCADGRCSASEKRYPGRGGESSDESLV